MQQRSSLPAFALVSPVQLMVGGIIFLPAIYVLWLSLHQSSFGQAASFVAGFLSGDGGRGSAARRSDRRRR